MPFLAAVCKGLHRLWMPPKHQAVTHTGKGFFRSGGGSGRGKAGRMPKLKHLGGNTLIAKLKSLYIIFCEFATAVDWLPAWRLALWNGKTNIHVRPKGVSADLLIRGNTSDLDVFRQIFIQKEYDCLLDLKNIDLIIDAGANVGYSSVYFLSHFPGCQVVAIEPDPANFSALTINLAPYRDRVILRNCGIWSRPAQLAIESNNYRDGRDWTRQVRECAPGEEGEITAITIGDILGESGRNRLSLLKMDIEGAEAVVFADASYRDWLSRTDAIAIELHDDTGFGDARKLFAEAIHNEHFEISHSGELTICRRP